MFWYATIGFLIVSLVVILGAYFWRLTAQREKAKRESIDTLIRDMSDEDLIKLKQRLSDTERAQNIIRHYLDDDKEMARRS